MAYFGTPLASAPDDLDDDGIVSPDGRHFIKVTHRGVLPQGVTEGTLWVFDTTAIERAVRDSKLEVPKPIPLARMSAAVNGGLGLDVLDAGNTVTSPQWSEDGRSLTFLGRDGRVNRQLFRVSLDTGTVEALTPSNQDVLVYARSGSEFVYLKGADADLQAAEAWMSAGPGIPDMTVGTGIPLMPLLYPHFRGNAYGEPLELEVWRVRDDRAEPVVNSGSGNPVRLVTRYNSLLISFSSDATRVVTIAESNGMDAQVGSPGDAASATANLHYLVIDLRSGLISVLDQVQIARPSGR
jgi:dipeptidyl aminopeptidase/acylaminoacyl peptidase